MTILSILEELGSDSSRLFKIKKLQEHKDNKEFLRVLDLALNPYVNFYVRQIPKYTIKEGFPKPLNWALDELSKLSNRDITGNAAITHLHDILSNVNSDDAIVIQRIIGKDLRCGVAEGTVNAAIKDLIPDYPCLLARPYDEKNIKNIKLPAYSQLKADGLRVNGHIQNKKASLCGRSGRAIDLLGSLDKDLEELGAQFPYDVVFDGELVVVDKTGSLLSRKVGNGIINKAIKGTISKEEADMVCIQLWDVIPRDEFLAGKSKDTYDVRLQHITDAINAVMKARTTEDNLIKTIRGEHTIRFWLIESKEVDTIDEAVEHFTTLLAKGEEGTILKNKASLWENTRSKHLVKFKAEKECDLEVIGFNPGEGKFTGMVGSLIMASSDRKVEVAISGFSDDLRKEITKNFKSEWLGSICAVKYNERIGSKDKNRVGIDSLFSPRFEEKRSDKKVADSSKDIE